jgi:hypothetical protein
MCDFSEAVLRIEPLACSDSLRILSLQERIALISRAVGLEALEPAVHAETHAPRHPQHSAIVLKLSCGAA